MTAPLREFEVHHLVEGMGRLLHSVNFKSPRQDCFIDRASGRLAFSPVWVPLADGMLDVPIVLGELKTAGYNAPISIHCEYRSCFFRLEKITCQGSGLNIQQFGQTGLQVPHFLFPCTALFKTFQRYANRRVVHSTHRSAQLSERTPTPSPPSP